MKRLTSARDVEPLLVLGYPSIAHLGEAKVSLQNQEGMFDFGSHARFVAILSLPDLVDFAPIAAAPIRQVARFAGVLANHFTLTLIGTVVSG